MANWGCFNHIASQYQHTATALLHPPNKRSLCMCDVREIERLKIHSIRLKRVKLMNSHRHVVEICRHNIEQHDYDWIRFNEVQLYGNRIIIASMDWLRVCVCWMCGCTPACAIRQTSTTSHQHTHLIVPQRIQCVRSNYLIKWSVKVI